MANEPTPGQAPSEGTTQNPVAPAPAPPAASENITAQAPAPAPAPPAASENVTAQAPGPASAPVPQPAALPTPSIQKPLPGWLYKADLAILALLFVFTFFLGSFTASNSDLWTNLAVGQRLSEGTFTFGEDPFSWLTEKSDDKPAAYWVHHSWLYSWVFFQLHELIGGGGLVLIKALLFTIAVGLLSRIGWNEANRWFVLITLLTAALAVSSRLLLQPIVISFLFLSITLFVLDRVGFFAHARPDGKTPCPRLLWVLPPLFALWANLDAWFILGPIVLGLCWAGTGLTRWFPDAKVVPGKTLGLVFGVGVLACLVNPYHVRVFQLPPELAYLLVSVTDALHLRLPNEVVGAGRTLSELKKGDVDFAWTIPSVSSKYWYDTRYGLNIAGLAVFPLLLLGLLAFTLTARIKSQPGAPTFHVGRFVLWLVFGVMALALSRMIPFFALVAAPLTAITLGEFLHWQQTVSGVSAEKRDRGLKLARLVSIPFVLLLIFLAWPGWLQGTTEFTSLRRVAWDVRAEPSLKRLAQTLPGLKKNGEPLHVFNGLSLDVAHHLSWFAPEVKFGIDSRFALYADRIQEYSKVRKALAAPNPDSPADWEDYLAEHKVDQVVVVNFIKRDSTTFPLHWWLQAEQWRQRGGDTRAVVFSWAGPGKRWPADDEEPWNRAAFGAVPDDQRPPKAGVMTPQTPSPLTMYFDGVPPTPVGVPEFLLLKKRYGFSGIMRNGFYGNARIQLDKERKELHVELPIGMVLMDGSLTTVQGLADGGGMTILPAMTALTWRWFHVPPLDIGPPAFPILMMRTTRQAVAENPLDAQSRLCLIEAIDMRNQQENHWVGGMAQGSLRERVRKTQVVANYHALTQVQPDNFESHLRFAQVLAQEKMLDLALEHMQAAEKVLEAKRPANANEQRNLEFMLKQLHEEVQQLDKVVRQRLGKWKDLSAILPTGKLSSQEVALAKAALAFVGTFDDLRNNQPVATHLGLGKKAFDILVEIDPESLPDKARLDDLRLRYQVLLSMGRANDVMESLRKESVRKALPPDIYAVNQLLAGAALGDYDAMEEALTVAEKLSRENLEKAREIAGERAGRYAPALLVMPKIGSAATLAASAVSQAPVPLKELNDARDLLHVRHNELSNCIALRGIIALEAGNTKHARVLFQRALDEAGETNLFTDRPVARRYLELLTEQKR